MTQSNAIQSLQTKAGSVNKKHYAYHIYFMKQPVACFQ